VSGEPYPRGIVALRGIAADLQLRFATSHVPLSQSPCLFIVEPIKRSPIPS
jgi:hypothetical protein